MLKLFLPTLYLKCNLQKHFKDLHTIPSLVYEGKLDILQDGGYNLCPSNGEWRRNLCWISMEFPIQTRWLWNSWQDTEVPTCEHNNKSRKQVNFFFKKTGTTWLGTSGETTLCQLTSQSSRCSIWQRMLFFALHCKIKPFLLLQDSKVPGSQTLQRTCWSPVALSQKMGILKFYCLI